MSSANDDEKRAKRRRMLIALASATVGFGLGQLCPQLPERYQAACRLAHSLWHLFAG